MNLLDDEWYTISTFLELGDLLNLLEVSKSFNRSFSKDFIWKSYCLNNKFKYFDKNFKDTFFICSALKPFCRMYRIFLPDLLARDKLKVKPKIRIPYQIKELVSLQELEISEAEIYTIPEAISTLNISILTLNNNLIRNIPTFLFNMTNLKELDLSSNIISKISPDICKLTNLKVLKLKDNKIKRLPDISNLSNLEILDVSINDLDQLPNNIDLLPNIFEIDVRSNNITSISSSITKLTTLKYLDIKYNNIIELPEEFVNWTTLSCLSVCKYSINNRLQYPFNLL